MTADWHHLFLGREPDLQILLDAWAAAKAGRPQLIVVLADSGLGKTRLVQQFYRRLATAEDDGGYWPDAFSNAEQSLDVNPAFGPADGNGAIPWLWWGIRCVKPDSRNLAGSGCALIDAAHALGPHVDPILLARDRRDLTKGAAIKAAQAVGGLIPGVNVLFALKDMGELLRDRAAEVELRRREHLGVADREAGRRADAAELALDAFRTVLDPKRSEAPTVPAVVLLDDAQWADPTTLDFVERLLAASAAGGWPCLIVATHWEREWNEQCSRDATAPGPPTCLAHVPERLRLKVALHALGKVPDLTPMARAALPGLTPGQLALIAANADGNPLYLIEILHYLRGKPPLFEGRDLSGPLTPAAERRLGRIELDYTRLVEKRFEALSDRVKDVLGWSSYQGTRFLREVTRAAAARLDPNLSAADVDAAFRAAERPHALVQHFASNLSEFRQNAFREVARAYLDLDEDRAAALAAAVRDVLAEWINAGRIDELPEAERMDALLIATRELEPEMPADPAVFRTALWARATAKLHDLYADQYLLRQAHQTARRLFDARPQPGGWPLDVLEFWPQTRAVDTLLSSQDSVAAEPVAAQLVENARRCLARQSEHRARHIAIYNLVASLSRLGSAERNLGRVDAASKAFGQAVELVSGSINDLGKTVGTLIALSHLLGEVSATERYAGRFDSARYASHVALEIALKLDRSVGEKPVATVSGLLATAWESAGDAERRAGNLERAVAAYREALEAFFRYASQTNESNESFCMISSTLISLGHAERERGRQDVAIKAFRFALKIDLRLLTLEGETPRVLTSLAHSLRSYGDARLATGRHRLAERAIKKALEVSLRRLSAVRETPDALWSVMLAFESLGDLECDLGRGKHALEAYLKCVEIDRRLVTDVQAAPWAMRGLYVALTKCGDIRLELGERDAAMDQFREALEIGRSLLRDTGENPQTIRDVAFVLGLLARAESKTPTSFSEAQRAARESAELFELLVERYGATEQRTSDVGEAGALSSSLNSS